MIGTIHGPMDETLLAKKEGAIDNEREHTRWVEFWQGDELVHRSAHVHLKQPPTVGLLPGNFTGA